MRYHSIVIKKMEKAYGIEAVLKEHMPALQHGSDGLIFTSAVGPYVMGTDERMSVRFSEFHYSDADQIL